MAEEPYCSKHDSHCVQIERLERDVCAQKNEIKDARKSLAHDMERRDAALIQANEREKADNERLYVTKDEFDPIKKLVYGIIMVILAEVIRRAFL